MNLSSGELALVLAACVVAIGGIVIAWQRGLFGKVVGNNTTATPAADAKPATGEPTK